MIVIRVSCDRHLCSRTGDVAVSANQAFSNTPLKHLVPPGWRIRTPRGKGIAALTYCPDHHDRT